MKISTLQEKKLDELREIACELDLSGYSDLRKQDLIYRILEAQAEGAASDEEPREPSGDADALSTAPPGDGTEPEPEESRETASERSRESDRDTGKPTYMRRYDPDSSGSGSAPSPGGAVDRASASPEGSWGPSSEAAPSACASRIR